MSAIKHDAGKPRYDLIPPDALAEVALAYTVGCKYGARNWEQGMRWGRMYRALLSHANAFWGGESRDHEGHHHLAAVVFCAMALMSYERRGIGEDDRSPPVDPCDCMGSLE